MRGNRSRSRPRGLPAAFTLRQTLLSAASLTIAVLVGVLAIAYPVVSTAVLVATFGALTLGVAVRRLAAHRPGRDPVLMVRIPFTDFRVEV